MFPPRSPATYTCALLQVSWTSLRMTLGGSVRGGEASCSAVPYSSSRPCRCSGSHSPCPRGRNTPGRASRPCFPRGTTRGPSRATGSCGTRWTWRTARPASSSCEVRHCPLVTFSVRVSDRLASGGIYNWSLIQATYLYPEKKKYKPSVLRFQSLASNYLWYCPRFKERLCST